MRIGIDATTIYTDQPTGLGVYSISVINELAKLHDNLVVWTVDDSRLKLRSDQIRRVMQPLQRLGNQLYLLRPVWVEAVLPHLIKKEKVDLLYTTIPNGLSRSPVPHVVTAHDIIPLTFPEDAPRTVRWSFRHRLPKIFERANAIVAVSNFTRNDLLRCYSIEPEKIWVISEGYDRDNFVPRDDFSRLAEYGLEKERYLLYVGNSSARKNLIRLIEAFSRVANTVPYQLVLAGSKVSVQIEQIKRVAAQCGVSERVIVLNYVPYTDLSLLYSGAALFLFVSEYEGFGLPLLEAMACGAPVLAADATSLPEVAGKAAFLVPPRDVVAIADAMRLILIDDARRESMRKASLARAAMFSWETTARDLLTLFQQV
ncbi:MAG: glycosyltransferase family 1 protein [Gammaproteobacteria bacterium]|nr:MAG: glycosyltransferase family 1 protein [Gammaproteobacteria bacterium]